VLWPKAALEISRSSLAFHILESYARAGYLDLRMTSTRAFDFAPSIPAVLIQCSNCRLCRLRSATSAALAVCNPRSQTRMTLPSLEPPQRQEPRWNSSEICNGFSPNSTPHSVPGLTLPDSPIKEVRENSPFLLADTCYTPSNARFAPGSTPTFRVPLRAGLGSVPVGWAIGIGPPRP
jgi:hypothetical protein